MARHLYLCLVALCLQSAIVCGDSLVGGWTETDSNLMDVQDVAKFALEKYNQKSNDVHLMKLISVVSAQTQVVSGINYKVTVEIGKTTCRKNHSGYDGFGQTCDLENSEVTQKYLCTFKVYKRPWPKGSEEENLQSDTCNEIQ